MFLIGIIVQISDLNFTIKSSEQPKEESAGRLECNFVTRLWFESQCAVRPSSFPAMPVSRVCIGSSGVLSAPQSRNTSTARDVLQSRRYCCVCLWVQQRVYLVFDKTVVPQQDSYDWRSAVYSTAGKESISHWLMFGPGMKKLALSLLVVSVRFSVRLLFHSFRLRA